MQEESLMIDSELKKSLIGKENKDTKQVQILEELNEICEDMDEHKEEEEPEVINPNAETPNEIEENDIVDKFKLLPLE